MHVDGISILFSSFFILPSAFLVDFDDQSRDFFKLFYVILFIIFYESRLPQNLYHVTKFFPKVASHVACSRRSDSGERCEVKRSA